MHMLERDLQRLLLSSNDRRLFLTISDITKGTFKQVATSFYSEPVMIDD